MGIARMLQARGGAEIISMDSALVYRGMDIGTAKPTASELAEVPHHLINIRDPLDAYSAAEFARDARQAMTEIIGRGRLPLVVGGTMLYYKALLEGLDDMPPADPAVRAAIDTQARALGWPALHRELSQWDPATAERLSPNDSQRISRAIEVFKLTGKPLSHFHAAHRAGAANQGGQLHAAPGHSVLIALEPTDRAWLHMRIAKRFDDMLRAGFLDEVQALRARGDLHANLPSMRCVGYRQAWDMLDGRTPPDAWCELAIIATRQLAKRQLTWLRSLPQRTVVPADDPAALAKVLAAVSGWT